MSLTPARFNELCQCAVPCTLPCITVPMCHIRTRMIKVFIVWHGIQTPHGYALAIATAHRMGEVTLAAYL